MTNININTISLNISTFSVTINALICHYLILFLKLVGRFNHLFWQSNIINNNKWKTFFLFQIMKNRKKICESA
jgi:hypothetical protein